MIRRRALAAMVAAATATTAFVVASGARADSVYHKRDRVDYIARALDAFGTVAPAKLDALDTELYLGARRECRAAFGDPTVGCLIEMATKTCNSRPEAERPTCQLIADIVVTNQLSQSEFVDNKARIAMLNKGEDFRGTMRAALRVHYAGLVTRLSLSRGFRDSAELPPAIDQFCVDHTRARRLTWQRCVAAVVWYIGTSEGGRQ